MKRFIWLAILVAVLGILGYGGYAWVTRNSGTNLLVRSAVALHANDYDKARELAQKYIDAEPDDEKGYERLALVSVALAEYDRARQEIQRGLDHVPGSVSLRLMRAETYSYEAVKKYNESSNRTDAASLRLVAELLDGPLVTPTTTSTTPTSSNPLLRELLQDASVSQDRRLDIQFLQSQNYITLYGVRYYQFVQAAKEQRERSDDPTVVVNAQLPTVKDVEASRGAFLEAMGGKVTAAALMPSPLNQAEAAQVLMARARDQAIVATEPVATAQPLRGKMSMWLIQYLGDRWQDTSRVIRDGRNTDQAAALRALQSADETLLNTLQTQLLAMKPGEQPLSAVCQLVAVRLTQAAVQDDAQETVRARQWATNVLDTLMASKPRELEPKERAVGLALASNDAERALSICDEALKIDPINTSFRVNRIRSLMALNRIDEAEMDLKTPMPGAQTWTVQLDLADMTQRLADRTLRSLSTEDEYAKWRQQNDRAIASYRTVLNSTSNAKRELLLPDDLERWEYSQFRAYRGAVRSILAEVTAKSKLPDSEGRTGKVTADDRKFFADTAYSDADQCYRQLPRNPEALRLYVEVALMANHNDAARTEVNKAAAGKEPVIVAAAARLLAAVFGDLGASDAAVMRLNELVPDKKFISRQDRVQIAESLLYLNRPVEAATYWSGIAPDTLRAPLPRMLGQALVMTGQFNHGIEFLQAALKSEPRDLDGRMLLAKAHWEILEVDFARDEVNKVLDEDDEHEAAHLLLARINMSQGLDPAPHLAIAQKRGLSGLALAIQQRQLDNIQECIKTCDEVIASTASDADKKLARYIQAEAKQSLGQRDEAVNLLVGLIREEPKRRDYLRSLASIRYSEGLSIPLIMAELGKHGADPSAVRLWAGETYLAMEAPAEAVRVLEMVRGDSSAPKEQRGQAWQLLANAYAKLNQIDEAMKMATELEKDSRMAKTARMMKIALLIQGKKTTEAVKELDLLRKNLESESDYDTLLKVADMYRIAERADKALEVYDHAIRLNPSRIAAYKEKAHHYLRDHQTDQARTVLDQALTVQKDNPVAYTTLANLQEHQGDLLGAADTLAKMESLGDVERVRSMLLRAELFARYQMTDRAAECLEILKTLPASQDSQLRLRMGRLFAQIDMPDEARACFDLPDTSPLYVPARLMAVELIVNSQERREALDDLAAAYPKDYRVMQSRMVTALVMRENQRAIDIFLDYRKDELEPHQKPAVVARMALEAYTRLGNLDKTLEFCRLVNPKGADLGFNQVVPLLASKDKPEVAMATLSKLTDADLTLPQIILGILSDTGKEKVWYDRLKKRHDVQPIAPDYMALAARVAGDMDMVKKQVPNILEKERGWSALAARQFLSKPDTPQMRQQAKELLRLMETRRASLTSQTWQWGMELLKQDPTCLWTAQILFALRNDETMVAEFEKLLKDSDSRAPEVTLMQAELASWRSRFKLATTLYEDAAKGLNNPTEILLMQARAAEANGDVAVALDLYKQILPRPGAFDLGAKNSAAYLVTQLPAPTTKQLEEARKWAMEAVETAPNLAAARDTLGWVCFLLGDKDLARAELSLGFSGLVHHPEAHYHMAMVELAFENVSAARLHLDVAAALIEGSRVKRTPALDNLLTKIQAERDKLDDE